MMHESNRLHRVSSNSKKKSYSTLKVSMLGNLAELTQGQTGSQNDGGSGGMMNSNGNP
jgi:hypothetical protein